MQADSHAALADRRPLLVAATVGVAVLVLLGAGVIAAAGGWYAPLPTVSTQDSGRGAQEEAVRRLATRGIYLVVDSYHNRLRVYRDGTLLRDALCSTGSGVSLSDPVTGRRWVFDTPSGERRVLRKVRDPVWIKPDWAFIEEGYEPPAGFGARADDLSLGEYGLYLGEGYIIHGTLFSTLLGQAITHGCIRLGDADLEWVFRHVPLGARVYLY